MSATTTLVGRVHWLPVWLDEYLLYAEECCWYLFWQQQRETQQKSITAKMLRIQVETLFAAVNRSFSETGRAGSNTFVFAISATVEHGRYLLCA